VRCNAQSNQTLLLLRRAFCIYTARHRGARHTPMINPTKHPMPINRRRSNVEPVVNTALKTNTQRPDKAPNSNDTRTVNIMLDCHCSLLWNQASITNAYNNDGTMPNMYEISRNIGKVLRISVRLSGVWPISNIRIAPSGAGAKISNITQCARLISRID
jgi:hypothetical protein